MDNQQRLAFPTGFRFVLRDDVAAGATALDLPARRMWPAGLVVGAIFAIFAGIEWTTMASISAQPVHGVSDLVFFLLQSFWIVGWSLGVLMLGALTVLLLTYGESARLQSGKLV